MTKRKATSFVILISIIAFASFYMKDDFQNLYDVLSNNDTAGSSSGPSRAYWKDISGLDEDKITAYLAIRETFEEGDFSALEAHFKPLLKELKNDTAVEGSINFAISALRSGAPQHQILLDNWIAQYPESAIAHLVRANYFSYVGGLYRGDDYYRELSDEQKQNWHYYADKANMDLSRSLELDPSITITYADRIYNSGGTGQEKFNLIAEAFDARPESYAIRAAALSMSRPRWGGSMTALEAIVEDTRRFVDQNASLKPLLGYVEYERASKLFKEKRYYEAKQAFAKALSHGNAGQYLSLRALMLRYVDEADKAFKDYMAIMDIAPVDANNYYWIGRHYYHKGEHDKAIKYLSLAAQLRPYDYDAQYFYGLELENIKSHKEAANAYKSALYYTIEKGGKAWMRLGNLYSDSFHDAKKARYAYVMALQDDPESPLIWFNYSFFLGDQKDCDIIGAAYIHSKVCEMDKNKKDSYCAAKYLDRDNGILTALSEEGTCPAIGDYISAGRDPLKLEETIDRRAFLTSQ
ncbi:GTP cyclohydrolase III (methanopterin) [Marinobacterium lacunae]|uniref:GTP cyclohydrolase III (Methanopterin) n=1 Tax=Marinobacterium lacunae TaxID=1232683 RepID=A0A081FTD5_9GAMM|nr:DUF4034 domain-containing protein [Marinobacterium lacunae]KEA61790.1 GTP cyclohydrolase III (methanopterin) [Marinobacterium lacunae]